MISLDTFYQEVQLNFRDLNGKMDDLCNRTTRIEDKIQSKQEIEESINKNRIEHAQSNNNKFYAIIGIIGVGFGAFEVLSRVFNF